MKIKQDSRRNLTMAWNMVGQTQKDNNGGSSDLVKIEDKKKLRLILPESGPISHWFYTISTPAEGYRTWVSPEKDQDFFATNRNIFGLRPTHAGLAFDYEEGKIKILEAGNQIWEGIKVLVDAGKDINNRDILIMKKGTGRSTEYTVTDCDPTPAPNGLDSMERPDLEARYIAPTFEQVLEDLKMLGFTNPEQIFEAKPLAYEKALLMKVPFGKHKGKTMQELISADSQYITFLATKIDREDIKECARVISNTIYGTAYTTKGITPSMEEVTFVAPTQDNAQPNTNIPAPTADTQVPPAQTQAPQANGAREAMIQEINNIFETKDEYKDFMKIIGAMKEASAPHGKTSINEFTDTELARLKEIVLR